MAGQKTLTPQEREAAAPLVQGAMQTYQQHYGVKLTEQETNRVLDRALDNLKSTSTGEVKGAVRDQMFALLIEKDPGRAIELRMETRGVSESERSRIQGIAEDKGFRAANAELAKLKASPAERAPAEKPSEAAPEVAAKAPKLNAGEASISKQQKAKPKEEYTGLSSLQMIQTARRLNTQMENKAAGCEEDTSALYKKYSDAFLTKQPRASDKAIAEHIQGNEEYQKEKTQIIATAEKEINQLRKQRDSALKKGYSAAIEELTSRPVSQMQMAELDGVLNQKQVGLLFDIAKRDMSAGEALQNAGLIGSLLDGMEKQLKTKKEA